MISSQRALSGMLNLDTHILIDALRDNISKKERGVLAGNRWCISAIVLWELAKLKQLGRIDIAEQSVAFARALSQIEVIPLTIQICQMSTELDIVSDPADEIIAATSIVHRIPLLTRDRKLLKSKVTPLAK